jgi:HK97 family phage major capsid protein
VEELETNQADVKESLKKVADEIADIISQIEESEAAQDQALDGGNSGGGETDDDDGQRSRRRGERRSIMPVRMDLRTAQAFQRTGRHTYKDVRSFIRGAIVTGDTARPTTVGGINEPIGGMSSLIDMIKVTDCTGIGTYRVAMVTEESAAAAAFTEGTAPAEATPKFDYVDLTPTNYGTLAYISKEIRKQTPLEYEAKVNEYARRSLRKKLNSVTAAAALESKLNTSLTLTGASGAALITPTLISVLWRRRGH